jgi:hypothetical protein
MVNNYIPSEIGGRRWAIVCAIRLGVKHGWIYRFFFLLRQGLAGRALSKDRPTCRLQGSGRRSGRFPALPYPPAGANGSCS